MGKDLSTPFLCDSLVALPFLANAVFSLQKGSATDYGLVGAVWVTLYNTLKETCNTFKSLIIVHIRSTHNCPLKSGLCIGSRCRADEKNVIINTGHVGYNDTNGNLEKCHSKQ